MSLTQQARPQSQQPYPNRRTTNTGQRAPTPATTISLSRLSLDLSRMQQRTIEGVRERHEEQFREQKAAKANLAPDKSSTTTPTPSNSKSETIPTQVRPNSNSSNPTTDPRYGMTTAERIEYDKAQKEALFTPPPSGSTKAPKDSALLLESQLDAKSEITNDMEEMASRLREQVGNINKGLVQEKDVLDSIESHIEETTFTLQTVNKRLGEVVTGAWWDLFTNFAMMITVCMVFVATMGIIFVIPKAKWF